MHETCQFYNLQTDACQYDPVIIHWIVDVYYVAHDRMPYAEIVHKLPTLLLYNRFNPIHELSEGHCIDRILNEGHTNDVIRLFINGVWYSRECDVPEQLAALRSEAERSAVPRREVVSMDRVFFHLITEENGYLSNWYPSSFEIEGVKFSCVEQYLMYKKATLFEDTVIAKRILETEEPAIIKKLGREVRNYKDAVWSRERYFVCLNALRAKFSQNRDLREQLLDTSGRFAECAVNDHVWGIGLAMNDPGRFTLSNWKGQNLLGAALGQVYSELEDQEE